MAAFESQKKLVLEFYKATERDFIKNCEDLERTLEEYTGYDWVWRGMHPFNELQGHRSVCDIFWRPLAKSFRSLYRRQSIFFGGLNYIDDYQSVWVVSMGHLVGLFDEAFLSIPPTKKVTFIPYCEFNRVKGDRILETAMFMDIPHIMMQAGVDPFRVDPTGAFLVAPAPQTTDALKFKDERNRSQSEQTLKLVNKMISDVGQWSGNLKLEDELRLTWAENMSWWGPAGIGCTYTIERYAQQHSAPFRASFTNRSKTSHKARFAEGNYCGFFGWPNFTVSLAKPYLGVSPSNKVGEFRVVDLYRTEGDKLVENWVFIDLLHWMKTAGRDVLAELDHHRT